MILITALLGSALAGPPNLGGISLEETLSADEWRRVDAGQVVHHYVRRSDEGLAVALVHAPEEIVWRHILDFDRYVDFMPYVTASSMDRSFGVHGLRVVDCVLELTAKGIAQQYTVRNIWQPQQGLLWFVMLPRARSPLQQARGLWLVQERDDSETLVAYRLEWQASWFVPGLLQNKAARIALPRALSVIKARSERTQKP